MSDNLTLARPRRRETVPAARAGHAPRPAPARDGGTSVALGLIAICALMLGAWLPASHYVLGYPFVEGAEDAFFNELLAGVIIGCAGYGRLQSPVPLPKLTVLQATAGAWLAGAPWLVGYAQMPPARFNDVACGVAAVLLAAAGALFARRERRRVHPAPPASPAAPEIRSELRLPPQIIRVSKRQEHARSR